MVTITAKSPPTRPIPVLSALSLSPSKFRAAGSGPSIATSVGTTVKYTLSEAAKAKFRVERASKGRRVKGTCVKPTRLNAPKKPCTRYVTRPGPLAQAHLPAPDQIAVPAIRSALENYDSARATALAARSDLTELDQTRPKAIEADAQALADAQEAGKPDPGPEHVRKHDERIADAQRQTRACEIVAERSYTAVEAAITEHSDAWRKTAAKKRDGARKKFAEVFEQLAAVQVELALAEALAQFTERGGIFRLRGSSVPLPGHRDGRVSVSELLAALRTLAEPQGPEQPPAPIVGPWRVIREAA